MITYYTTWLRGVEPKLPPMTEEMKDEIAAEAVRRGLPCCRDDLAWFWIHSATELSTTWRLALWMPSDYADFTYDMASEFNLAQTVVATHPEPLVRITVPSYVCGQCAHDLQCVRISSVWMFPAEARVAIQRYVVDALRNLEDK